MEIEGFLFHILRRPRRVLPPNIRARLKHICLRQFGVATALEILLKKREKNVLAVILAGIRGELHAPEMLSVIARPSAVYPRTYNQPIEYAGIILVDRMKGRERSLQILGIKPTAHRQHRAVNILHVRSQVS